MSSDTISLVADTRDLNGDKVKVLRTAGRTPAVVHDHGKESLHIAIEEKALKKVFSQAGKHHPVELTISGKKYTTLIKEVTFRPAANQAYHAVFQSVKANETVKAEVPVVLVGEKPAERASLLVLQGLDILEVEALPRDLVDQIDVDATVLAEDGDKITVADITAPKGVTILTDSEQLVAHVETPKDQIAEADAAKAEMEEADGQPTTEEEAIAEMPEPDAEGSKNDSDS